jgi:sugar/nucleoside kinase (ribokinase family)
MKVLGIGESVIDNAHIFNQKNAQKHVGGPSLIGLILLSRLGIDTTLLTTVGRDEEATIIRRTLKHEKVKMLAKLQKKTKINNYIINPTDGSREKLRGDTIHPFMKHLDRNFIRQFDLIIIDRHEPIAFYEILKKKNASTKIIIDPSTELSDFTVDMIQHADYPIVPIETLMKIGAGAKHRNLLSCLQKLYEIAQKTVIVTAGEHGSIIYDGKHIDVIPTLRIKAVDVQGAGDVYRGAFAFGLIQKWDIKKCVAYANTIAALHCTKLGNAAAIPTQRAIKESELLVTKQMTVPNMVQYFSQLGETL